MRRAALLAAALAAACSAEPRRPFPVGLLGPVSSRVAAEAGRLGLDVSDTPAADAAIETAALADVNGSGAAIADWTTLRFAAARAAANGAAGVYFRLPAMPDGRDLLDYPEEWQAVVRAAREPAAMRPVLEEGKAAPPPFEVPDGLTARAWTRLGRGYLLLVNSSGADAALDGEDLVPWRALFEVRSDARELLRPCGEKLCIPPGKALWLEARSL